MMLRLSLLFCCLVFITLPVQGADDRQLLLEAGRQELGKFNYGDFLFCLENAAFDSESPGRKIETRIKRLVVTTIHDKKWFFELRETIDYVIIEGITINTQHYSSYRDKSRLLLHIFSHCRLDNATSGAASR